MSEFQAQHSHNRASGDAGLSVKADDHLSRLLAPDTEIPWYKSILDNITQVFRPEKLPPLKLTSTPIAVKDIWGEGINPKRVAVSVLVHGAIFAALIFIGTNDKVQKAIERVVLIATPPAVKPIEIKPNHGGGGGSRSPLPALKAELPKRAPKAFTPPLVTITNPALVMDASLIAPPDAWAAGAIGNPLGQIGGGGLGTGGGIGNGRGSGVGDGTGSGAGGGNGAGIYSAGNGITNPTVITMVDPEYSDDARKARFAGSVILSIVVSTNGRATDVQVVKSVGMGLDEKAIEAVRKWLFKPGSNKGVPVNVRAQVKVTFTLL